MTLSLTETLAATVLIFVLMNVTRYLKKGKQDGDMAQLLRSFVTLTEEPGLFLSTHIEHLIADCSCISDLIHSSGPCRNYTYMAHIQARRHTRTHTLK